MSDTKTNLDFVHLHAHTHHSVQDALPSPEQYAKKLSEMGFRAGAITDHGRISGAVAFSTACQKVSTPEHTVKPILGCEFYTYHDRFDKNPIVDAATGKKRRPKHNHITLLAQTHEGYRNLLRMASIGAKEGYYYEPTIDHEVMAAHSEGVIAMSGCMGSEVCQSLMKGQHEKALETATWFKQVYGDRYYIEMHYHGIEEQKRLILPGLWEIAKRLELPVVCANDVHYLEQRDWEVHKAQISMRDQDKENTVSGKFMAYQTKNFHLKSYEEMARTFGSSMPQALSNTVKLAETVETFKLTGVPHLLPKVDIPIEDARFMRFRQKYYPYNKPNEAYLAYLAFSGLKQLGLDGKPDYIQRLRHEIDIICYMGVVDYFLIQREMVAYMKGDGILYGIRGSGVGCMVNYCLNVCPVDPIKWDLIFERFLNPGRGTHYKVDCSEYTYADWKGEGDKTDPMIAAAELRSAMQPVIDEFPEHAPQIHKELWVLENHNQAAYVLDVAKKGVKTKDNECQLWTAWALGVTDQRPESDMIESKVATLPDIDTDIEKHKREKVMDWMRARFGEDKCSQIGTWGTYGPKAAITGVLKISPRFQAKYGDQTHFKAQEISKSIPQMPDMTFDQALEESPEFAAFAKQWPEEMIMARRLVGVIQNFGIHAAGVLVSSEPICDHAPLENSKGVIASGYDMFNVENVGLVKYDLLGLQTYSMVALCLEMIAKRQGEERVPNLRAIIEGQEDKRVLKLFADGKTDSVFQFAGGGMKKALQTVKADCIEDLIAVNALFRPGPKAFIPNYAEGKKNPGAVKYSHPIIKEVLSVTYGIPVYQEQAMKLGWKMAGFNHDEVDKLRKAVSKKNPVLFAEITATFREKALAKGISESAVNEVLDRLKGFDGYAFNRSHACAYSLLAYTTAYLRVYFPSEWLAACMQCDRDDEDKMAIYRHECQVEGIRVCKPNVNESGFYVTVNKRGDILLPINSIKGIGDSSRSIIDNQPYDDLMALATISRPNRGIVAALADNGALDCFKEAQGKNQEQIMLIWDEIVAERTKQEREAKKAAKSRYTVISPMQAMQKTGDDDELPATAVRAQRKQRETKTYRSMNAKDLFADDLL